jgi:hypothetical protein
LRHFKILNNKLLFKNCCKVLGECLDESKKKITGNVAGNAAGISVNIFAIALLSPHG